VRAIIRGWRRRRQGSRFAGVAPALLPVVNLALALLLSGLVVVAVGENPARALWLLASGAFGSAESGVKRDRDRQPVNAKRSRSRAYTRCLSAPEGPARQKPERPRGILPDRHHDEPGQ